LPLESRWRAPETGRPQSLGRRLIGHKVSFGTWRALLHLSDRSKGFRKLFGLSFVHRSDDFPTWSSGEKLNFETPCEELTRSVLRAYEVVMGRQPSSEVAVTERSTVVVVDIGLPLRSFNLKAAVAEFTSRVFPEGIFVGVAKDALDTAWAGDQRRGPGSVWRIHVRGITVDDDEASVLLLIVPEVHLATRRGWNKANIESSWSSAQVIEHPSRMARGCPPAGPDSR